MTRFLRFGSPIERETARTPFTRHVPKHTTAPPEALIRAFSSSFDGLWMGARGTIASPRLIKP